MNVEVVEKVLEALEREAVHYVIFGAVALNLHGLARTTQDLDLFVEADSSNIGRLRAALKSVFEDPGIEDITAEDLLGDYPAIQYIPPTGAFHIDILTRLGEAFRYEDIISQRIPFRDFMVQVATPEMLYRMKKDTVRPKDRGDAEMLKRRFKIKDD